MGFIGHPKVINGQCLSSTVAVDCGLWTVDCGLWTTDCGLRTADSGLRTTDCGLRIADLNFGRQTEGCRELAVSILSGTSRSLGFFTIAALEFRIFERLIRRSQSSDLFVCLFVCFITVWAYLGDPFNQHLWTEVAKLLGGEWIATCTEGLFLSQKELRAIIISGGCWS